MKPAPYASYRPSGVEWLGEVPEHWRTGNLRRFALMRTGHTPTRSEPSYWEACEIPWFTLADVWQLRDGRQIYLGETKERISQVGLANSAAELLPAGTVVLSRTASVGFSGIMPVQMATSQDFWNWVPGPNLLPEYLLLLFRSMRQEFLKLTMGSTHKTIYQADAARLCICVPPLNEQRAIANFLDRETAKIDALVARKRTLIERLKEKRNALISRAVTRGLPPDVAARAGLDPHPTLKPSGIDWLGEVPEHWTVTQLRRRCTILDCMHRTVSFVDDGVPIVSIREVHGFEVDLSNAKQTTEEEYLGLLEGGRRPRFGDIIYSRNATVGDAAIVTTHQRFAMGQDVCLLRPKSDHPRYLLYLLKSEPLRQQLESYMIGATFRRINVGQIKAFWGTWPSLGEQESIAAFLDHETEKIDKMAIKVEAAIERLHEYRSALITAAVTGKIDVRKTGERGVVNMSDSAPDVVSRVASGGALSDAAQAGGRG